MGIYLCQCWKQYKHACTKVQLYLDIGATKFSWTKSAVRKMGADPPWLNILGEITWVLLMSSYDLRNFSDDL